MRDIQFLKPALNGIEHHHERFDGRGYPVGLAGDDIPLFARIVAVADAFESLTTSNVDRAALPVPDALEEVERRSGTQFDPVVVAALRRGLSREPWPLRTLDLSTVAGWRSVGTTTTTRPSQTPWPVCSHAERDRARRWTTSMEPRGEVAVAVRYRAGAGAPRTGADALEPDRRGLAHRGRIRGAAGGDSWWPSSWPLPAVSTFGSRCRAAGRRHPSRWRPPLLWP